jgi:hypothetical protein
MDRVAMSQMFRSRIVTDRISGRSRLPPQVGQGLLTMYFSSSADVVRVRLAEASLEVRDRAFEGRVVGVLAALVAIAHEDLLVLVGIEQVLERFRRQVTNRARKSQPWLWQMASRILSRHEASVGILAHGTSAPSARLFERSGMTRSGSMTSCVPSPVQLGQAPCGELNEKLRGSSSSIVNPSYGHE